MCSIPGTNLFLKHSPNAIPLHTMLFPSSLYCQPTLKCGPQVDLVKYYVLKLSVSQTVTERDSKAS